MAKHRIGDNVWVNMGEELDEDGVQSYLVWKSGEVLDVLRGKEYYVLLADGNYVEVDEEFVKSSDHFSASFRARTGRCPIQGQVDDNEED